jgi:tRNA (guanine37-N1)-methyltransferase
MDSNKKLKVTIITLFPSMIEGFLTESIVGKAVKKGQVELEIINLRDFAKDTYGSVDDRPYGGGAGMVLRADVLHACLQSVLGEAMLESTEYRAQSTKQAKVGRILRKQSGVRVLLTSAKGHTYSQAKAEKYVSKYDHLVIIAGHYEGVDERILQFVDEEISIGQYVLTGGELPAAIIADSVIRLIPGVLKKDSATQEESWSAYDVVEIYKATGSGEVAGKKGKVRLREYPHYTRPEEFMGMKVPEVLTSGDHQKIRTWRLQQALAKTKSA